MKGAVYAAAALLAVAGDGCSIRRMAMNRVGDAIASGGSTYESDDDVELVGSALPFGLKIIETLLSEAPRHKGLLTSACQGFSTYAYVYVHYPADVAAASDLDQAEAMRARARRLYLRAHRYGLRGLELAEPGISARMTADPKGAAAAVRDRKDVPLLYWNAVALGLAISVSKGDAAMLARLPEVEALIERAAELDPGWNAGAIDEFQVTFASAKPGKPDYDRIREHYRKALELSQGKRGGLHVAYAEAAALPRQDRSEFRSLLDRALATDPDRHEEVRLVNMIAHRRARWLLGRIDELILTPERPAASETAEKTNR